MGLPFIRVRSSFQVSRATSSLHTLFLPPYRPGATQTAGDFLWSSRNSFPRVLGHGTPPSSKGRRGRGLSVECTLGVRQRVKANCLRAVSLHRSNTSGPNFCLMAAELVAL